MERKPYLFHFQPVDVEILEERVIDEKSGDREIDIKVKFQEAGIININHRRYNRGLLEKNINDIQKRINEGESVWGMPFHPADGLGKPIDVSHVWKKVWMESDGGCYGMLTLLPTPAGKTIHVLISRGRKLGMSSRGFGTVTEKTEKIDGKDVKFLDVNDDYRMETPGDWVVAPSVPGAGNLVEEINILESKLNEGLDLMTVNDSEESTMDLKELKEKHPELVKQVEDEKAEAIKAEAEEQEKVDTVAKVTALEQEVTTLKEDKKTLEERVTALEEKDANRVNFLRGLVDTISKEDGVLPEDEDDEGESEGEEKSDAEKELESKLADAKKKITALEAKVAEGEKKQTSEEEVKEEEPEEKEEKEETSEEEKKEEKPEETKPPKTEQSDKLKADIKAAGTEEKGNVESPEGKISEEVDDKLRRLFHEARTAGFKGDFAKWKETYPAIVETVTG